MTTIQAASPPSSVDWWSFRDVPPRTVADLLAAAADAPSFLLDGLVHPSATLLTGPPKAGKSFLVMEWVEALTTGRPWHGREVLGGPRPVLILPTDPGGQLEYARRFGWGASVNVGLRNPPRPGDQSGWQRLAEDAARTGVGLVVLDNLYSYNPTAKINDNGEVGVAFAGLGELGRVDVPYLVVHHPPKGNPAGYAGTVSIEAHFRLLNYMEKDGHLTIAGNDVAAHAVQLVRGSDGRTHEIRAADLRTNGTTKEKSATARRRQEARESRVQEAISLLQKMPTGLSDREKARQLAAAVDGITTDSQGRTLLKNAEKFLAQTAGNGSEGGVVGAERSALTGG